MQIHASATSPPVLHAPCSRVTSLLRSAERLLEPEIVDDNTVVVSARVFSNLLSKQLQLRNLRNLWLRQ